MRAVASSRSGFAVLALSFLALAFLALIVPSLPAAAQPAAPQASPATLERLTELSLEAGQPLRHTLSPRSGRVAFLGTPPGASIPARGDDAEARARDFLAREATLFGLRPSDELKVRSIGAPDAVGMERVRFQQTVDGVPVTGGEISVHLRGDGVAAVLNRASPVANSVETTPTLAATSARLRAAQRLLRRGEAELPAGSQVSAPRLEILDRAHLGGPPAPVRLAWFVEARSFDRREYVWIDARTGATLLHFSQLPHARDRKVYDADDPGDGNYGNLPGVLVREELDGPTGDADADDAFDFAGHTWDYYSFVHGRDSYDGAGATLRSSVHFCPDSEDCPYENAFWNGIQMVYGEGFSAADDVVAHELTHAVTEHSADLFYYMQSGALNESFSDIFGETIDLSNGAGNDGIEVRWLLGEDVPGDGAIRDLQDPNSFGDPAKVSEYQCYDTYGYDRGGVHINSGIPNHAYALMVDGGFYNSVAVDGLGLTKPAKIQYRALTEYLVTSSSMLDDAAALAQACSDLVGTAGINGADCNEVDAAIAAVEMAQAPACAPQADPPLCGAGETAVDVFYDDFEELADDRTAIGSLTHWAVHSLAGSQHWGLFDLGPYAVSGKGNLYAYDHSSVADSAMAMNASVPIPNNAFLHFRQAHGFDNFNGTDYDGGVLEYSTDGDASWHDAGSLISAGEGYGGTLASGFSNPLAGRSAFTADSFGYSGTKLNLANFSGSSMRFRFRLGTDNSFDDYGWFIDDVRIYTCQPGVGPCVSGLVLQNDTVASTVAHVGCDSITAGNSYTVSGSGDLTLTAPSVLLTNGFSVASGGKLTISN